jgi:mRNA interferase RelE/StbE
VPDPYRLLFDPGVHRDQKSIPKEDLKRILRRIDSLTSNPRPVGSVKVSDPSVYRLRQGDYRVLYHVDDAQRLVRILRIGHRREVYRS